MWISQTYHTNTSNKAVDFGSTPVGTPVYAMANGVIGTISSAYGSYLTLNVDNSDHKLFYVHVYKFKVAKGQRVVVGQQLAEIAPQSVNGGYAPHLHLGLQPQYNLMDYLSRDISIQSKYTAIQAVWFDDENRFDWSKHKDLSYENTATFKKGEKVQFTGVQNARKAPAGVITGESVVGQTGSIYDNPREAILDGINYTWYDIHIDGGGSGWFADVGKFEVFVAPQGPTNCEEEVNRLLGEIEGLRTGYRASQDLLGAKAEELTKANGEIKLLKACIEENKNDYANLEENYQKVLEARNRIEQEKLVAQEELDRLQQDRDLGALITEILRKLFKIK